MNEQTQSIARYSGVLFLVILLLVAGIRYFGGDVGNPGDGASADDGSPNVIRSIPSGARIFFNNSPVGVSPMKYESIDAGILRIRLELGTFAPVETLLIVPDDGPVPTFPPFVFSIPVELSSVPPGAEPIVDGRLLRAYEVASLAVPATDTLEVAFELGDELTDPVLFNPVVGIVDDVDTIRWKWQPAQDGAPARLTGVFAATQRITSEPPGALVYLDDQPLPIGKTNGRVSIPYGEHTLTLRLEPFDDLTIQVSAGQDRSEPIFARMEKAVWISAVDARNPFSDLNAKVEWVKQAGQFIITPDDRIVTPTSILLGGSLCQVNLTCAGFADTVVTIPTMAGEATVAMRAIPRHLEAEKPKSDAEMAWVRFVVKEARSGGVMGAEVFGVDKDDGRIVRYGPTDESGELTTQVPVGDYDWWAAKTGYVAGKPNGERVKKGRKTKEITLKLKAP